MTASTGTWMATVLLGALLALLGLWSSRNLDALVGSLGGKDLMDHRRGVVRRGSLACGVAGAALIAGGVVLAVVDLT